MNRQSAAGMLKGQKVLLVGLGLHGGGVATARWLAKHGATVRITDRKSAAELKKSIRELPKKNFGWSLGRMLLSDVRWADWVVQNPGVPNEQALIVAAKKMTKPVLNEAGLFFQHANGPIIGVTGTRGKTTTTLLIAHILKKWDRATLVAGNFRDVPMLSVVDRLTPRHWTVLELSSFQLEGLATVQRSPQIAVWTNLFVDHLNRYNNVAAYALAKSHILRYQRLDDVAVLNADSAAVRRFANVVQGQTLLYGVNQPAGRWTVSIDHGWIVEKKSGQRKKIVQVKEFRLAGEHQRHNLLAAVGACRAAGVPASVIRRGIASFTGVPHRQEIVRTWRGHRWVNDTTATSPEGALAAMAAFPGARYILGGTDKRLQFSRLVAELRQQPGPLIFLPGTATKKIVGQLRQKKYRRTIIQAESMGAAVKAATEHLHPGQDVVLTPGAASFGLFKHEFDRGEQFVKAVKALR